jgi:hypothetical protein
MFANADWTNVTIRNVSSRGMLLETAIPLRRGTYLEVRRGPAVIVGRTVWATGQQAGIQTQDIILIDKLISGSRAAVPAAGRLQNGVVIERRSAVRPPQSFERSKVLARASEFAAVCGFALVASVLCVDLTYQAFAQPVAAISEALQ